MAIRPLAVDDRTEWVRVATLSWPQYAPWFPELQPGETFEARFDDMLERSTAGQGRETEYRLIGLLADGRIGAMVNLFQIERRAFQCGIASWAANSEVAGQGLATEAVAAMLDLAFAPMPEGLGLHRVAANIIPHNVASLRVAEKNGFRREGLGKNYLRINGRWQDHAFYAKLAEEHRMEGSL